MAGVTICTCALPWPPAVNAPPESVKMPSLTARNLIVFGEPGTDPEVNPRGVVKVNDLSTSPDSITYIVVTVSQPGTSPGPPEVVGRQVIVWPWFKTKLVSYS